MTREEAHDLMENELRCIQRSNYCDRDCAKCPLVKDDKELIEAYGYVIKMLEQQPCDDAISRQSVLDMIENAQIITDGEFCGYCTEDIDINILPPVTPQRKVGKWIDTGSGQKCSLCGEIQYGYDSFRRFCASCGERMQW
jgi:aerobic-type carbon monoxide dehydrogenase small subunit (CoxS/CutS family)